ncbi:MAG: polyribonucleotide nucleotidyltransferase [Acidobacteria bacterium]|nr:MAG: polyribonucleotide nucleotidyltransferase [Acidobacteriota bacterium]
MVHRASTTIGGRELVLEAGNLAKQAHGSVQVRYGDTVVLVTACSNKKPREIVDFLPLTVDYRENYYAAGRIPGGFFKREGKPSEKEVLTSRLIDRPIRPLFPEGYFCETQIIALVLSADNENDPDTMSITGASTALLLSNIPFYTPIAGVRVGLVNGQLAINPASSELKTGLLNLIVAGSEEAIVMVEAGAQEVSEKTIVEALAFGHAEIKKIIGLQKELAAQLNIEKRQVQPPSLDPALYQEISKKIGDDLQDALNTQKHSKLVSYEKVEILKEQLVASYPEEPPTLRQAVAKTFDVLKERIFRDDILNKRRRPDGRGFDEIRPISCEVGLLPRTHGSALFTRGETQALVIATLGTSEDAQKIDIMEGESSKRFMLHYNFPLFSVGEVAFLRGPGRREVGHGALAERAILPIIPPEDKFPYTIRIVSDILESNGSSSMATVCGGVLSLMDAGVPIKAPVAGVAMGLVKEGDKYAILTDIAGAEDHYGDMDFKVAGTKDGITALQMDIKIGGITTEIMSEALDQALRGRLFILEKMARTLPASREKTSRYAPRIYSLKISQDKIRDVIGPGGKVIRSIIEQTGVKIDVSDDGKVNVAAADESAANKAIQMIKEITAEAEMGKTYLGKVVRLADFGAFVEIFPGTDGLLHISEVAEHRIRDIKDELKEGDQLLVKVIGIDGQKIKLSRKAVLRDQREKRGEKLSPK